MLAATGCASAPGGPTRDPADVSAAYVGGRNVPSHGVALEGWCPVSYRERGGPRRGSPQFTAGHLGATYWFSSAAAKEAFLLDPERYVPAFGGWCAYGMAVQDKFPVDPLRWKIVDDRLLVFLRNGHVDALSLWDAGDERALLARAEAHWRHVRD